MAEHSEAPLGHIHKIVNWVFNTDAEFQAFNSATGDDTHKVAYVEETLTYYLLQNVNTQTGVLTWQLVTSSASSPTTNLTYTVGASTVTVESSNGADAVLPSATDTEAGVLSAADKSKLDGIAVGATVNASDQFLLDKANHFGNVGYDYSSSNVFTVANNSFALGAAHVNFIEDSVSQGAAPYALTARYTIAEDADNGSGPWIIRSQSGQDLVVPDNSLIRFQGDLLAFQIESPYEAMTAVIDLLVKRIDNVVTTVNGATAITPVYDGFTLASTITVSPVASEGRLEVQLTDAEGEHIRWLGKGEVSIIKAELVDTFIIPSADTITTTTNFLLNGEAVLLSSSGSLPTGLDNATKYYIISGANYYGNQTFQISLEPGGVPVTFTNNGSGTLTLTRQ